MDFRGVFEDGMIRPAGEPLPNGTEVTYEPVTPGPRRQPGLTAQESARLDRITRTRKTLKEIQAAQGNKPPIQSLDELRIPGLENEDVDEFLRSIRPGHRP